MSAYQLPVRAPHRGRCAPGQFLLGASISISVSPHLGYRQVIVVAVKDLQEQPASLRWHPNYGVRRRSPVETSPKLACID
jgi:hypothetical protein